MATAVLGFWKYLSDSSSTARHRSSLLRPTRLDRVSSDLSPQSGVVSLLPSVEASKHELYSSCVLDLAMAISARSVLMASNGRWRPPPGSLAEEDVEALLHSTDAYPANTSRMGASDLLGSFRIRYSSSKLQISSSAGCRDGLAGRASAMPGLCSRDRSKLKASSSAEPAK